MLDNEKPIEIAAAMNLERTRVYRDLRNYFREFDNYRRYAINVNQDIFDRYEISQAQWEEILGATASTITCACAIIMRPKPK